MTEATVNPAAERRWCMLVLKCAVCLLMLAPLTYVLLKPHLKPETWLERAFKGHRLTVVLSMDGSQGRLVSSQLPSAVVDDLKSLTLGTRPRLDSVMLTLSEPYGMIDIVSDSGAGRLEWHVDLIADPSSSPTKIWTGRGPLASSYKVSELGGAVKREDLDEIVAAWEKAVRAANSRATE